MTNIDLLKDDPFNDLRKPPYSDNAIIGHALKMMDYTGVSREAALVIMVKTLADVNSEYFDQLLNIHKPTVYQVNYGNLSPGMQANCDKVRSR